MKRDEKLLSDGTANFLSGTAGGIAQVLVGHPFDTIKVRLQTQNGRYKNALDCLVKTVNHENVRGLYKGVSSPILGISFCNAVLFTANGFFRSLLTLPDRDLSLNRIMIAGSLAGAVMALANCPIELLKVRLQVQDSSVPQVYRNIFDCARQTFAMGGARGMYRGFVATIMRDIPSFAGYFGVYEGVKLLLRSHGVTKEGSNMPTWQLLLAGGIAGFGAWLPCYPQDVIKSRMQASSTYKGTFECVLHIYRQAGLRGFFRGFGPTLARAFPANAATFFVYELVHSSLS